MVIIFNPAAGRRRAQLLWRVLDVMAANGVKLEILETAAPGHATELARQAVRDGAQLVVAAGGDGTIAEVANGLSGTDCPLGIIPLGTANVLARELALPFTPKDVAASLVFRRTCTIWPGLLTRPGRSRLFVQMVGAGFDAQVVHRLPGPMKRALGRGAYVVQTLRELGRYSFPPIHLRVDGTDSTVRGVIVTKGHLYAGSYCLAPGMSPLQTGFTVVSFPAAGPFAALAYGAALPLNMMPHMPGILLQRACLVEILSDLVPAQADGDAAGDGPMRITDALGPIRVVTG